jgi:chemotaxis protein histidine kinase CheA
MKFNSTVALTFVLLILMIAAGAVSGLWGYAMGYEALKGVTQPDTSPSKKLIANKANTDPKKLTILLKESDILKDVKEAIRRGNENVKNNRNPNATEKTTEEQQSEEGTQTQTSDAKTEDAIANFPVSDREEGITMEVINAKEDAGSLLLEVNLKNESSQAVRFLYSFLEVKDNRGRSLSAVTDGLPGELPPNSENFSGVVKVPTALLEGTDRVSLSLTDYPDQKLQLSLANIPVD